MAERNKPRARVDGQVHQGSEEHQGEPTRLDGQAQGAVLIVDDEQSVRTVLSRTLAAAGYSCQAVGSVREARAVIAREHKDIVLLDIRMPEESGLELLREVASLAPDTITMMITAEEEVRTAITALKLGAYDYILKPFDIEALRLAVGRACQRRAEQLENRLYKERLEQLVRERTQQLTQSLRDLSATRLGLIRGICRVAEFRAPETGAHLERMAAYCREIAERSSRRTAGDFIEALYESAPLHDVGKVGIPDAVLLKPGSLTAAEFEIMKGHALLGRDILRSVRKDLGERAASFLDMAIDVCAYHHEAWDGSGYPEGLAGEAIPLAARIVSVADFYDATTYPRVYRPKAFTHDESRGMLVEKAGQKFDPMVVAAFLAAEESILAIRRTITD
jgi:putative two-component system response regulator